MNQPLPPDQLYRKVMESLPVGYMRVDHDGIIVEFNSAAEAITGYAKSEVIGKSHFEILHGSTDPETCPLYGRARSVGLETTITSKTGQTRILDVASTPLFGKDGRYAGGVELFRDISEGKRAEREHRNFLAMIAHDMKNPLVVAGGFLERVASGKTGPITDEQRDCIEILRGEVEKLKALIADFIEFVKLEGEQYKPSPGTYDLGASVSKQTKLARARAGEKNVTITLELPSRPLPEIPADAPMMDRVIGNLLDNAIKYTPAGGSITVRVIPRREDVLVEVADNGRGIPREDLPYIFDAFHRVSGEVEGTGLGLSFAKKVIKAHGGRIWVESQPGAGSTFHFTLKKQGMRP